MRWLGRRVSHNFWSCRALQLGLHFGLHHGGTHSRGHNTLASGRLRSRILILERLLKLDSLDILLIFNFLLHVLVPLQKLIMLCLAQLKSFVQVCFKLFLEGIHFILLLLNELRFMGNNFLGSFFHVFFALFRLQLLALDLNLMCFLIPNFKLNNKNNYNSALLTFFVWPGSPGFSACSAAPS